ncbi:MAG: nickel pincer cofactor biosynthesis protein LarC [Candidatus Natronoplasma sp.]
MRKTAYFDLESGISGDKLLGSLIDLGGDVKLLDDIIEELDLKNVHVEIEERCEGVKGKDVTIKSKDQPHRTLADILDMIDDAELDDEVRALASEAFKKLGEVESEIHDEPIEDLELHEVGMVDSIIDIIGSIALFHDLNFDKAYCSTVTFGSGYTECEHGKLPVPVPAVEKLLEGWKVGFSQKEGELITPTGAVLLRVLTEQKKPPDMELEKVGVGFGSRKMKTPNALRVFMGTESNIGENVHTIRFYVDDMTPEVLGYGLEKIRKHALDAYSVPASGKKSRPGWEVVVITEKSSVEKVIDKVMEETSTLGLRIEDVRRFVSGREVETIETKWGEAKVKIAEKGRMNPEYESCRKIAEENDVPLQEVYREVERRYREEK